MNISNFFYNNYIINNHPIMDYPCRIRNKYLSGLGSVLFIVSEGNSLMNLLFTRWSYSINKENNQKYFVDNIKAIKKVFTICFYRFKFFYIVDQFIFDCFYL
ncbi:MAG: hypothetical protein MJ211_12840, partial [Bacteroidales bacterium]|nr:hypothetical protein [Bacteroidales bacterium]